MTSTTKRPIQRALISVSDKTGIVEFAEFLQQQGVSIISTGGTAKTLQEAGIAVTLVADVTQFPEIMQGRVKTLHPKIHGGILAKRDQHAKEATEHGIEFIDLVICNLYPFVATLQQENCSEAMAIENIDIGGPSMIRAAAKNFSWVTVIVEPQDYNLIKTELFNNNAINIETRKELAAKAFAHTAQYDTAITRYLKDIKEGYPETLNLSFIKDTELRYGENPQQTAAVYKSMLTKGNSVLTAKQLQGKQLSYNNIVDAEAALNCVSEFTTPSCVVVKHTIPCGVASSNSINTAFQQAFAADSKSAFGGVIALNTECTKEIAEFLAGVFIEIIIAPSFTTTAQQILATKNNLRLLSTGELSASSQLFSGKFVQNGLLLQSIDTQILTANDLECVTNTKAEATTLNELLFAWQVVKHCKSNAIVVTKNQTTLGVGAGQVSRIDAVDIAIHKAQSECHDAVLASDAFFPFRDSIDAIAKHKLQAIIQPGGSKRDAEVITACNEHGIAMYFTGKRCFLH